MNDTDDDALKIPRYHQSSSNGDLWLLTYCGLVTFVHRRVSSLVYMMVSRLFGVKSLFKLVMTYHKSNSTESPTFCPYSWPYFNIKTCLFGYMIPIKNIIWSWDPLIVVMGIPILVLVWFHQCQWSYSEGYWLNTMLQCVSNGVAAVLR